jgi:hypothetical protein
MLVPELPTWLATNASPHSMWLRRFWNVSSACMIFVSSRLTTASSPLFFSSSRPEMAMVATSCFQSYTAAEMPCWGVIEICSHSAYESA